MDIGHHPKRKLAVAVAALWLCAFSYAIGGVLEIPGNDSPVSGHEDSREAIPSGPDLQFQQLLKFYGCWKATVTRRDLTAFRAQGKSARTWTDQLYTICFARDLGGELQPSLSQTPLRGEVEDKTSFTEIIGYDDRAVSLINRSTFIEHRRAAQSGLLSWLVARPKAVEVRQVIRVSCLRQSLELICTATADAQCGDRNCYSFGWKARFHSS